MKQLNKIFLSFISIFLAQILAHESSRTQFASHVSVNTPARSYTHGVGDPVSVLEKRAFMRPAQPYNRGTRRPISMQSQGSGYSRQKPITPFRGEEVTRGNSPLTPPWQNKYIEYSIPILPPSPYKVDSPDAESLWPVGLFVPPMHPPHFQSVLQRLDTIKEADPGSSDPYLLQGSDAVGAISKSRRHGLLYFHDIPHIESLLANQQLRVENNLKPHRLGSIRHTWPFNRT